MQLADGEAVAAADRRQQRQRGRGQRGQSRAARSGLLVQTASRQPAPARAASASRMPGKRRVSTAAFAWWSTRYCATRSLRKGRSRVRRPAERARPRHPDRPPRQRGRRAGRRGQPLVGRAPRAGPGRCPAGCRRGQRAARSMRGAVAGLAVVGQGRAGNRPQRELTPGPAGRTCGEPSLPGPIPGDAERRDHPRRRPRHPNASALPKALHPIAGRPMLNHLLAACEAAGFERIVVVVGPGHGGAGARGRAARDGGGAGRAARHRPRRLAGRARAGRLRRRRGRALRRQPADLRGDAPPAAGPPRRWRRPRRCWRCARPTRGATAGWCTDEPSGRRAAHRGMGGRRRGRARRSAFATPASLCAPAADLLRWLARRRATTTPRASTT